MKIMLAGQAYYREDNGQAVFTIRLARGLAAAGHRVLVLAPCDDGKPGLVRDDAVEVWKINTLALPHNVNISLCPGREITKALSYFVPDIIHLQDHYFICRPLYNRARKKGIPVVGSNHFLPDNVTANLPLPDIFKPTMNRLLWLHMFRLYNRLSAVSTPTATAAAILRKQHLLPSVTPISCGIDTNLFHPIARSAQSTIRHSFSLPQERTIFIYVGRLDHEKGLDTVIKAFARLYHDCLLILAGKGSFQTFLKDLCQKLEIASRVRFPGFIPKQDLPRLLACCDCFVMAGFAELQSIATLEAMACGLPIIAADARALPELVKPEKNGLLFRPGNVDSLHGAMDQFLRRRSAWKKWGQASRAGAEEHAMEKSVRRFLAWYEMAGSRNSGS